MTSAKKLKASIKQSLKEQSYQGSMESLGIPKTKPRKTVSVYKLYRHLRATLDHQKHPSARMEPYEQSAIYATWEECDKVRKKVEKTDNEYYYYPRQVEIPVDEVDKKTLEKCKLRGWGFHG
jgi:hypothetical protein